MAFSGQSATVEGRIAELLEGNKSVISLLLVFKENPANDPLRRYQGTYHAPPKFEQIKAMPNRPPAVAIITCGDPRVVPEQYFDFKPGSK